MRGDTCTHQFNKAEAYTVCIKTYVHCGRKKICKDVVVPYVEPKGVVNILFGLNEIKAYLNPASGQLSVCSEQLSGTRIQLFDVYGRLVHETAASQKTVMDISQLPPGTYLIQFTGTNGERVTRKIIKD